MTTLAWMNILNSKWVFKHNCGHGKAFCLMKHRNRKSATSMISSGALQCTVIDHGYITRNVVYHHRNVQDINTKIRSSDLNFGSWWTFKKKKANNISKFQNLYMRLKIYLITPINKITSSISKLI